MSEWVASYYLYIAALLFSAGVCVIITKKNLVFILIGVELMLNSGNIILAYFSQYDHTMNGQIFAIFSVVLTVCEVAIALAILLNVYKKQQVSNIDELQEVGND